MGFDTLKLKRDFERAAVTYDDVAGLQRIVLHTLLAPSGALFSPVTGVLDAGCGTGALLSWLQDKRLEPYVVPLDLAFAMCRSAASRQAVPSAVNANIESLCFEKDSFDVVVSSLALQWVNDVDAAFLEFYRVMKPGGTLLVSSFGTSTLHELKTAFSMTDGHVHVSPFLTMEEYARAAREAGFTVAAGEGRLHRQQVKDFDDLLLQIKSLGAGNKWRHRRKGLTTRRQLERAGQHYRDRFGVRDHLPVTWEIITMRCKK